MHLKPVILLSILFLAASVAAVENSDSLYLQAGQKFQNRNYADAVTLLERAVADAPGVSRYHHLLGKCYGRMAETAGAFRAFSLARKTRHELEKAVELDGENMEALQDLMEYYREAPVFLGGSSKKAGEIEERLTRLNAGKQRDESQTSQQNDLDSTIR